MKKVWIVKYQTPGRTDTESFDSFEEAKFFARKLISKYSEVPEYLDDLREGRRKKYRAAIADFFEKYFKDPHFPYSEADIPSDDADDYEEKAPEGMLFGADVDEDDFETDYDYDSPEDYFAEDDFYSPISSDGMGADDSELLALPNFSTNLVLGIDEDEEYEYDENRLFLNIRSMVLPGGSSNPVLILSKLKNGRHITPKDYKDEYNYAEAYGIEEKPPMSMRTVYRHIEMLRDLGYVITKEEGGFTLEGKTAPKTNIDFGTSAYPIMLLDVLEEAEKSLLQEDIISAILKKYHVSIHRKTIGRLINGLIDLGYYIEHTREGYVLK